MKAQESLEEGPQKPLQSLDKPVAQPHVSESDLVAELLRDRLATKLTEEELTSLIREITTVSKEASTSTSGTPEAQKRSSQSGEEDRVSRLKSSIEYIEHKCREIERVLRATDRHVRTRERAFRDRSPLGVMGGFSDDLMYGHPLSTTLITTRVRPAVHRSRNPWLNSYFS